MSAPPAISEDDIYRLSSQYRLWSFTTDQLDKIRASTNSSAAGKVRTALKRTAKDNGDQAQAPEDVDCLSPAEELKLLRFYSANLMGLSDFLEYPTNVKATAVQYLKRFYLHNSPMTYDPKAFVKTAFFLATKSENHHISLSRFATKFPDTTPEAVKAPEFTLIQSLRFTFDVRHPHRGLEGGFMELQSMLDGTYVPTATSKLSTQGIAKQMLTLGPAGDERWEPSSAGVQKRLQAAHQKASAMLKTTALLSDAYFLYTPAQIWLASLLAADQPLGTFYLQTILASNASAEASTSLFDSIFAVLEGCQALLKSKDHGMPDEEETKHLRRLAKKLGKCQNPEKADLSSLTGPSNPPSKRDSDDAKEDEHAAKKRKVEDDDIFGGELKK